jgi:hypothetical protein
METPHSDFPLLFRGDAQCRQDDPQPPGWHPGLLETKDHERVYGRTEQRLLRREEKSAGLSHERSPHRHPLLGQREAQNPIPLKTARNLNRRLLLFTERALT